MGRVVQSTAEAITALEEMVRGVGPDSIVLDKVTAAILRRVLTAVKDQVLGKGKSKLDLEVSFRADTPLEAIGECRRLFNLVFRNRRRFDLGLLFDRKEDWVSNNPFILAPEVWERMQARLLKTSPVLNTRNSELPMGWLYRLHLRAGERGLQVPGNGHTVEDFLNGPEFAAKLRERFPATGGIDAFTVLVEGAYMSEAQLDRVYKGQPQKRAAVQHLDQHSGGGLDTELLQSILTGDFDLAAIEGLPAHEALSLLQTLLADPKSRLVVSSDPNKALPATAACYSSQTMFGLFGVSKVSGKKAAAPGVRLLCGRDHSKGGSHLVPVKHVLLLKKEA